ncbi:MAG: hypothetical protein H8E25_14660 [Planctomycetes bacterium]|nr:hypothetical protein [Planctomycetota bacterium]
MILTSILLLAAQQASFDAQGEFQLFASVSYETMLPQDNMCYTDEIILFDSLDDWPRVYLPRSAFNAMLPDFDGDGFFDYPAGIDALALQSPAADLYTNYFSFYFSTDSNGPGYLDGDVLALDQLGGLRVVYSEQQIIDDLQITSGSFDIDGLCVKSNSEILLSFRDGMQSTKLGSMADGDILSWNPENGSCFIVASESQVQAWVTNANGSTVSIGDVKSLSYDHAQQAILFSVQSPSASDAAVFTSHDGGQLYQDIDEQHWQFRVPTELDALCLSARRVPQAPILSVSVPYFQPTEVANFRIRHALPGANIVGVCSSVYKITLWPEASVGFTTLSRNARFYEKWPAEGSAPLLADNSGTANYSFEIPLLPPVINEAILHVQARVDGQGLTSPLKLKVTR